MVIEANPTPGQQEETWSGISLADGVRLRPLPDLFYKTHQRLILRSPNVESLPADTFQLGTPYIASVFGSGYSIADIKSATKRLRTLAQALPDKWLSLSAPPDDIAQMLRGAPEARVAFEKHLRATGFASTVNDYFCSKFVAALLSRAGLISDRSTTITPCGLFDLLKESGWTDVTQSDFGEEGLQEWFRSDESGWRAAYNDDVAFVQRVRAQEYLLAGLGAANEKAQEECASIAELLQRVENLNRTLNEFNERRTALLTDNRH